MAPSTVSSVCLHLPIIPITSRIKFAVMPTQNTPIATSGTSSSNSKSAQFIKKENPRMAKPQSFQPLITVRIASTNLTIKHNIPNTNPNYFYWLSTTISFCATPGYIYAPRHQFLIRAYLAIQSCSAALADPASRCLLFLHLKPAHVILVAACSIAYSDEKMDASSRQWWISIPIHVGRRWQVDISRALVLQPKFIIADEPMSAPDVSIQAGILNLLHDR